MKKEILKIESKSYMNFVKLLSKDKSYIVESPQRYIATCHDSEIIIDIRFDDYNTPEYVFIPIQNVFFDKQKQFYTIEELESIILKLKEMNKK